METPKLYWIYDEDRNRITKTPVLAQAHAYARSASRRTGNPYACDNGIGNKSWYVKGQFVCNMH